MKKCTKCKIEKPATLEYFYWHKVNNAFRPNCKVCQITASVAWARSHKEQYNSNSRKHYRKHRKEICERTWKWQKENPEKNRVIHRKVAKRFRQKYPEIIRNNSVIRKAKVKKVTIGDKKEINEIYKQALKETNIICFYCKKLVPLGYRHVDHKIPLSKGGSHTKDNLEITCQGCNLEKRTKTADEYFTFLKNKNS